MIQIIAAAQKEKIFVRCFGLCAVKYALVCASIKQTSFSGKGKPTHKGQRQASGCEALPTFCTTAIDQVAAVLGSHTRAKAVGALPLEDAGLKGSFHDNNSPVNSVVVSGPQRSPSKRACILFK